MVHLFGFGCSTLLPPHGALSLKWFDPGSAKP